MHEILTVPPDPFGDRAPIVAYLARMRALGPEIANRARLIAEAEMILAAHGRPG